MGPPPEPAIRIERVEHAGDDVLVALAHLVPQLADRDPPTRAELEDLLRQPRAWLLAARAADAIVGVATVVLYRTPTALTARIEDVVVDASERGRGAGEALVRELLRIAVDEGAETVALTSRPEREAANRLYHRLGFVRRETNVYVWRPA